MGQQTVFFPAVGWFFSCSLVSHSLPQQGVAAETVAKLMHQFTPFLLKPVVVFCHFPLLFLLRAILVLLHLFKTVSSCISVVVKGWG